MNDRHKQLIEWAANIIRREIEAGTYGTITVHMNNGTITRTTVERSEVPDNAPAPAKLRNA